MGFANFQLETYTSMDLWYSSPRQSKGNKRVIEKLTASETDRYPYGNFHGLPETLVSENYWCYCTVEFCA